MFGIVTAAKQITERAVDLWWFAAHSDGPLEVGQRLIQVGVRLWLKPLPSASSVATST